jgi:DNA-binding protein Fis
MEKSNKETIMEYTHKWKKQGNACTTTFFREINGDSIRQYFESPYYKHLMGSSVQYFYDVVIIAKRIE